MQLDAGDLRVQVADAELSAMRAQLLARRAQQRRAQHPSSSPEAPAAIAVAAHTPDRRVVATHRESGGPLYAGGLRVEVRLPPELAEQRRRKWRYAPAQCQPDSHSGAEAVPAPERRRAQLINLTDDRNIHSARFHHGARAAAVAGPSPISAAAAAALNPSALWQEDWVSDPESA